MIWQKVINNELHAITNCTLYHTYQLYIVETHSEYIQLYHHKSRNKNNTVNKMINIELHTITNCTTL